MIGKVLPALTVGLAVLAVSGIEARPRKVHRADEAYDYVIVGGGLAGLVLAERLSEDASTNVLVLEAGPDSTGVQAVEIPALGPTLVNTEYSWNFTSTAQPSLGGIAPPLQQGHTLGGGSAVNYMAYCRGSSSVFDEWAQISGDQGWSWDNLLHYFQTSTQIQTPHSNVPIKSNASAYGNGPVHVSYPKTQVNFGPYFFDAFKAKTSEAPALDEIDFNDGHGIGVAYTSSSIRASNATRSYSLPAYGYSLSGRSNAAIRTGAWAKKIGFTNGRATSVTYVSAADNSTKTVNANKEVILSAGTINTPKLLMLSGVGPKAHLEELGIPVVADIPGVGANLSDHYFSTIMTEVTPNITTTAQWANQTYFAEIQQEYIDNADGPLASPDASSHAADRVPTDLLEQFNATYQLSLPADRAHLLYQFVTAPILAAPATKNIVSSFVALVQPESRGSVRLASTDFRDQPLIDSNYYGSDADMNIILYAYKRLRAVLQSSTFDPIRIDEVFPGSNVTSDADLKKAIQTSAASYHHPVGTSSMGSVVDSHLLVKGLHGLRIVDASVFPVLPTCHIQSSVYATAERAADLIKGTDKQCKRQSS